MVNKVNDKEGKIELSSKGVPINWNGENWEYYKALMVSCFEEKDLENIASGEKVLNDEANKKVRLEWKQKQAQIKRMILGPVSLALAQRVMKMSSGTEMWKSLLEYYEAPSNQILAVHKQSQLLHKLVARRSTVAHIVGTMDYFVAYEEFDTVKDPCRGFAQNMLTHAVGMGKVELVTKSEKGQLHKFTLDRVLYVPSACWDLFSAGVARD
ncbi:hypothetical protein BBI17_004740 [Phytophthora kernoviae]|uniref:Retrovirus-related Pol polyprotein from transposon TNT 1-94-like beta-barrel domain-containing protein n=1 Tax=Phytophthora kernoviae TaxID=325452 RepID=A0A3R7MNF2_9STRA|nr:hypothetical protein BBI17_004740 [Phytophthora kernoviae]